MTRRPRHGGPPGRALAPVHVEHQIYTRSPPGESEDVRIADQPQISRQKPAGSSLMRSSRSRAGGPSASSARRPHARPACVVICSSLDVPDASMLRASTVLPRNGDDAFSLDAETGILGIDNPPISVEQHASGTRGRGTPYCWAFSRRPVGWHVAYHPSTSSETRKRSAWIPWAVPGTGVRKDRLFHGRRWPGSGRPSRHHKGVAGENLPSAA